MGLCYSCRSESRVNGGKVRRWRYQTVPEPCDVCNSEVSHEQVH